MRLMRATAVYIITCVAEEEHTEWVQDINMLMSVEVNFPIINDEDAEISELVSLVLTLCGDQRVHSRYARAQCTHAMHPLPTSFIFMYGAREYGEPD
jgi:hypothetical protein